jgi:endonuclease/exonuclease/phosphatase family metal-dependent hydrolase
VLALLTLAPIAYAQSSKLRVVTWNVSDYDSGERINDFRTAIYGVNPANSLSMSPDVFIGQEFMNSAAVTGFLSNVLNGAAGSPGDWAAAAFPGSSGTQNSSGESVFFYRTSKVSFLGSTIVNAAADLGTTGTDQPRNTLRFDVQVSGTSERVGMYSVHMKSGSSSANQQQRLGEAQRILSNAQGTDTNGGAAGGGLPSGYHWLVAGDFNIQSASQMAFTTLAGTSVTDGPLFDPINTYDSWNNNNSFKFVHTQDPRATPGGMDDRLDMILLSQSLKSGALSYVGNSSLAYSTSTWNDPNHSYRVWGNDGQHSLNGDMTLTGNQMVGTTIANAIYNTVPTAGGHLPVFLDLAYNASVPEPGSLCLLGLALLGGAALWRRR